MCICQIEDFHLIWKTAATHQDTVETAHEIGYVTMVSGKAADVAWRVTHHNEYDSDYKTSVSFYNHSNDHTTWISFYR